MNEKGWMMKHCPAFHPRSFIIHPALCYSSVVAERVTILTPDRVQLVGDFVAAQGTAAALLLHMMPAHRKSWVRFASALQTAGISSLAIDLRGHGESRSQDGRALDYQQFSDVEHQASRQDVQASLAFLESRGIAREHIGLVGASIGANLALQQLADDPALPAAVLLSPGLDYRGVETGSAVARLRPHQTISLVASREDTYSAQSVEELARRSPVRYQLKLLDNAGHGTTMFDHAPDLIAALVRWLRGTISGANGE